MIPSAKSRWFNAWFERQAYRRLRASFGALHIAGRASLEHALEQGPVLVVSNHSAWWDPLLVLVLSERFVPADAHAMMDATNLQRLPFFAKLGAFGVDRGSRRDGAEATRFAASLLDRAGRLVWIFAQGEERPLHERPLRFFGGVAAIAQRVPSATVLPVALGYAFGGTAAPSVYVAVGSPLAAETSTARARRAQVTAVEAQLDRVQHELAEPGTQGFEAHVLQRPRWLEGVAERALSALARPFVPGLPAGSASPPKALPPVSTGEPREGHERSAPATSSS